MIMHYIHTTTTTLIRQATLLYINTYVKVNFFGRGERGVHINRSSDAIDGRYTA